jgi:hypothetical protein
MTNQLPNREIVVYVLGLLGGHSKRVHTEDIAKKCHELFPDSFSWTKYPGLPDKDIVRVALTDSRKEQHGALVRGRSGQRRGQSAKTNRGPAPDGWILTAEGVEWFNQHREQFGSLVGTDSLKDHRQRVLKELVRIKNHTLYQSYREDPGGFIAPLGEIADLVRCRVDAPENVWVGRFESLRGKAMVAEQPDVAEFIDKCEKEYETQR